MFPVRNCDFVAAGLTGCAATDCVCVPVVGLPDVGADEPQAVAAKAKLTIMSIQRTGGLSRASDQLAVTEFHQVAWKHPSTAGKQAPRAPKAEAEG